MLLFVSYRFVSRYLISGHFAFCCFIALYDAFFDLDSVLYICRFMYKRLGDYSWSDSLSSLEVIK